MKEQKIKIYLAVVIFIFLFFTMSDNALAIEGTCSWHGGVNCNVMADWDGSTVCNDGWRDSSEQYYQMQECKINHHYCTQDEYSQIDLKYGLEEKSKNILSIQTQISQLQSDTYAETVKIQNQPSSERFANAQISEIQRQYETNFLDLINSLHMAQSDYWHTWNKVEIECYALGDTKYYKLQLDYIKQLQSQTQSTQNVLQNTCPSNLIVSSDKCVCGDGLAWYGNLCIPMNDYCHARFGINSQGNKQGCSCSADYAWNADRTTCIKVEVQATSQPAIPPTAIQKPELTPSKSVTLPKIITKQTPKEEQKNIEPEESIIIHATTLGQLISTSTQSDNSGQSFSLKENGVKSVSTPAQQTSQKPSIWRSMKRFFLKFKFW